MNDELDGGIPLPQAFGETKAHRSLSLRPICRIQGQSVLYREPYPKKKRKKIKGTKGRQSQVGRQQEGFQGSP